MIGITVNVFDICKKSTEWLMKNLMWEWSNFSE